MPWITLACSSPATCSPRPSPGRRGGSRRTPDTARPRRTASATEPPHPTPTEPTPTVAPPATHTPTPTETSPPTPEATLVLGPYLQSPRRDQIVVMWEV